MGWRAAGFEALVVACVLLTSCGDDGGATKQPNGRPGLLSEPSVHFAPLLESLASKDFDAAYDWLDARVQAAWPRAAFHKQVSRIRDQLGERWKPGRMGFMNGTSPQGPTCSASYRLEDQWDTTYSLEVATIDSGSGPKIVNWTIAAPCDAGDKTLQTAQGAAAEFLSHIRNEAYDQALGMVAAEARPRIPRALLAQTRRLFWGEGGDRVAFTHVSLSKLINGKWYYSVVAFPEGKEMNHLEVILQPGADGVQVASFGFKAKVAGPGSISPPGAAKPSKREN